MRKWTLLGVAIVVEVAAPLSLRASQDHSAWLIVVGIGLIIAGVLLVELGSRHADEVAQ